MTLFERAPQHIRRDDGVTLIEVVVVLAILAMTAAVAGGTIGRGFRDARTSDPIPLIASTLRTARSTAIFQGRDIVVFLRDKSVRSTADHTVRIAMDGYIVDFIAQTHVTLEGTDPGILFYPNGSSTGGRFSVHVSGRITHVVVDWLSGAVHVKREL